MWCGVSELDSCRHVAVTERNIAKSKREWSQEHSDGPSSSDVIHRTALDRVLMDKDTSDLTPALRSSGSASRGSSGTLKGQTWEIQAQSLRGAARAEGTSEGGAWAGVSIWPNENEEATASAQNSDLDGHMGASAPAWHSDPQTLHEKHWNAPAAAQNPADAPSRDHSSAGSSALESGSGNVASSAGGGPAAALITPDAGGFSSEDGPESVPSGGSVAPGQRERSSSGPQEREGRPDQPLTVRGSESVTAQASGSGEVEDEQDTAAQFISMPDERELSNPDTSPENVDSNDR
jgi:hypothetical protein